MGIILGFYLEIKPRIPFYLMLGLLPILYWTNKKQTRKGFAFFEFIAITQTILLGVFVITLSQSKNLEHHYSQADFKGRKTWEIKIREVLKPSAYSQRYIVHVLSLEKRKSNGKLVLSIPNDSTSIKLKVDDELFVFANAQVIKPPLNPYQFDYKDFLKKQGIYHQIQAQSEQLLIAKQPAKTIFGIASNLREHIILKLKGKNFGKDELSVIQALLLGQRDDISENTYNSYRDAGAIHILAVSGLHVGILLLFFQFLLTPLEKLPKGKTLKLILIILLLWGYAVLAGLSPSIVRAVTMFTFVAYAMYLNRPTNSFNIVALSMFFILLLKPLFLFQVGFQMSYAAVLAIVWIYPKLQRFWFPDNFIVRKTWQLLSVSIAAQLGVLPISLYYFHQFPALFFISNLLIIPFLGIILGMGVLVIVLSMVSILPDFLIAAFDNCIKLMNAVISWVAKQESFVIRDIPFDSIELVSGYFLIISIVVFLSKPILKNTLVFLTSIIVLQTWAIYRQAQLRQKESVILTHQHRNTSLLYQNGDTLLLYTTDSIRNTRAVKDFTISERISYVSNNPLNQSFFLNRKKLYIMDSLGIYPPTKHIDFLLLIQSPKINLERLIDSIQPKVILADGSNYKSYILKWKQTCNNKEIPFHSTSEKGFYVFD
ncbi:ComEC/Rec2 family competence protein [uncultured Allomuricauda sp.]|uniref:ComEC/Rec2 family competence protein n=1 Tax=Flagellimonas sp. W118 TaxID=3410791 RepID=UPI002607B03E|nr:ComEC/Rec2 family competence protein [uncultured Allomuricauda sp.]